MDSSQNGSYPDFKFNEVYSEDSSLQYYTLCLPRPLGPDDSKRIWVVWIHGGAWRDPQVTTKSFRPALGLLLQHEKIDHIAGFASISYRLSPYPDHPTNPSSPGDSGRSAKHPDHIHDVLAALRHLQDKYGFGERYLLVGHSCGATLAFQVAMGNWESGSEKEVTKPIGILGIEGVYDLVALVEQYKEIPLYEEIVTNAFGGSKGVWAEASPASGAYDMTWANGQLTVLAHSSEDELIDEEQHTLMGKALKETSSTIGSRRQRQDLVLALAGKHDEVWEKGHATAESIVTAVEHLVEHADSYSAEQ
ncbi:MAG: hypothetical protein M1812_001756 [Candelaria pacifica]|nr:MAG: hypothetical protein M1812_001756 [Candelaria pacifica]